jgi:predicted CoA-binding protein
VAIVGISRNKSKDSFKVANYLTSKRFRIIPINPIAKMILGEKCYKSLVYLPKKIKEDLEIVVIFRPSDKVLSIVNEAIGIRKIFGKPHVIWMQIGIINQEAAEKARNVGLEVIMNKCIMVEHQNSIL